MNRIGILTVLCVVLAIASIAPAAGIVNGSFESGLTGWSTSTTGFGSVAVVTSFESWLPTDGTHFAVITTDAGQPISGSTTPQLLFQLPTLTAGDTVSFDYFFDHNFTDDDNGDIGAILFSGSPIIVLTSDTPPIEGQWAHFTSAPLPFTGLYTLFFSATDGTGVVQSNLGVDNVTTSSAVVPEPLTMLAVFAGISGLGAYIRRRRA